MYISKHTTILSLVIIFFALLVAGFIFALPLYAQEDAIVFPIVELGNCENKEECRDYCDEPGNMSQCILFAKAHNLMTSEEADIAEKFSGTLAGGRGGPGGCTTPSSCEAFCEDITHLNECLAFADDHGHQDEFVEEGRKIATYLEEGGQMPGGCTSRLSCETYCSDFNHGEECLLFAETAGLEIRDGDHRDGPSTEQLRVMIDLMNRGETPGGCTSERECEAYCSEDGNFEECILFGEKVGFISPEEATLIRSTGGKGPGGCSSPRECDAFCNNIDNREQCFAFAKDHGLINEREIQNLEEGIGRLKGVLENAPEETRECLRHNLGENIISDIESGTISPGLEFARKVEACIHKGFEEEGQREFGTMMQGMPFEVRSCIEEKVGGDIREAFTQSRNNELEQVVKGCFESFRPVGDDFEGGFDDNFDDEIFRREEGPRLFHGGDFPDDFEADLRERFEDRFEEGFDDAFDTREKILHDVRDGIEGSIEDFRRDFQQDFQRDLNGDFSNDVNQFQPPHEPVITPDDLRSFDGVRQFEEFKIEEFKQFIEEPFREEFLKETSPSDFDGTIRDFETQSSLNKYLGSVLHATEVLFSR